MEPHRQRERLACLIVAHNLGDAVIQSMFLEQLVARGYARGYLVWTRPQVAFLFEKIPQCEVICSQFPVGTAKQMAGSAIFTFLKAVLRVRSRRPSVTIDLIGDLRDRLFARIAGTPRHLFIGWAESHPFKRLIRNPFGVGAPFVTVPADIRNVYAAYDIMLQKLIPVSNPTLLGHGIRLRRTSADRPLRVGLQPFASQACKLWPDENWRQLAQSLLARGAEVVAFGAPTDVGALHAIFGHFGEGVRLVTGSIPNFANQVSALDVMVGLDSFSVHMAQLQGVRSVMINAGNPPDLWAPPMGNTMANSGGCAFYPCYNVPKCEGSEKEYACVRAVTPAQVLQAVQN